MLLQQRSFEDPFNIAKVSVFMMHGGWWLVADLSGDLLQVVGLQQAVLVSRGAHLAGQHRDALPEHS